MTTLVVVAGVAASNFAMAEAVKFGQWFASSKCDIVASDTVLNRETGISVMVGFDNDMGVSIARLIPFNGVPNNFDGPSAEYGEDFVYGKKVPIQVFRTKEDIGFVFNYKTAKDIAKNLSLGKSFHVTSKAVVSADGFKEANAYMRNNCSKWRF